jgi:hypothetical protein
MVEIVYGVVRNTGPVFLPEHRALELAAIHEALSTCSTWGDFEVSVAPDLYEEYREKSGVDELPDADEFYAEELKSRPQLTRDEAEREYASLPKDERRPLPDFR